MAGLLAVLVVLAMAGTGWQWYHQAGETLELVSARGEVSDVPLEDGSLAALSAGTRLEVNFSPRARNIQLHAGEAYFDVAKDTHRPFVVQAGDARITAVGTRFSVRELAGGLRIVVTEGTVRLDAGANAPRVSNALLKAGAVATVAHGIVRVESRSVEEAEELLGWRNGELVFHATPLGEVVAEFNRFNARPLLISDPELAELRIDGGFRADNPDGFARLLEQAFPVRVVEHVDRIELQHQ